MSFLQFTENQVLTSSDMNTLSKQTISTVTSATRPGSPVEGQVIYETDTDKVFMHNGSTWIEWHSVGEWDTFSCALTDNGGNIGLGTGGSVTTNPTSNGEARYRKIGKTCIGTAYFEFGTGGYTSTGGNFYVSLPTPRRNYTRYITLGSGFTFDYTTGDHRQITLVGDGSNMSKAWMLLDNGQGAVTRTNPGSGVKYWGERDRISLYFMYETA